MLTQETRRRRKANIRQRLTHGPDAPGYCRIVGCTELTPAATGKGLSRRACRRHEDHYGRHGSYTHRTYSGAVIAPHRRAALAWLEAHKADPVVTRGVLAVEALYAAAGPSVNAGNLPGLPPAERARAAWARLRSAKVNPRAALAAWLAVVATIAADPSADTRSEFSRVQAAKVLHRMSSGTHRRWEREQPGGRVEVTEYHKYPASRGRVLRHIGEQLERAAELVAVQFMNSQRGPKGA